MEKDEAPGLESVMIQINPEIIAEVAAELQRVQQLREAEKRVEITTNEITARVDKAMREERLQQASDAIHDP